MFLRSLAPLTLLAFVVVGCNAILGYDSATLETVVVDAGDDAGNPQSCNAYCTNIMANCTGENAEYINAFVCMQMCAQFDPGVAGDETGNSLACRIWHTTAAKSDPTVHCRHAGPLGGGVCGTDPCSPFCTLDVALCSTQPSPPYTGESACDSACDAFQYDQATNDGDLVESSGNTLNCRLYHLESAYDTPDNAQATSVHCPHTAVASAVCK
jgi:hypothetical protein